MDDAQVNAADLLNLCLVIVKDKETEIRECYADPIDLSSDDFTQMVLMIAPSSSSFSESIWLGSKEMPGIICMIALFGEQWSVPRLIVGEIACRFLKVDRDSNSNVYQPASYFHLLHLLAFQSRPAGTTVRAVTDKVEDKLSKDDLVFPPATQLHEAGIKFKASNVKYRSIIRISIDIEFDKEKGILKIPNLCVSDTTEYISRNLIAFEQLNYSNTRYITDFHFSLNWLINTPEDVKLLVDAGIIKNMMGSNEQVTDLINSLDTNAYRSPKGYYYEQISLDLINHCKKNWPGYRAMLMHNYFHHPRAAISVVYAIALLLLTVIQVVASIMPIPKLAN